ncbi:MAG: HAMP domain-containing sensor histidine kinase [Flavobacteriaceae bacterium]|nr:HAMP domain-containing sensor histidine kinase [Flavobacteriaceae bacterium]
MKEQNYRIIVWLVAATILLTIGVQVYWNINNYRYNREQFDKQLQLALDNAFDGYYGEISKETQFHFLGQDSQVDTIIFKTKFEVNTKAKNIADGFTKEFRSDGDSSKNSFEVFRGKETDSIFTMRKASQFYLSINIDTLKIDLLYTYILKALPEIDSSQMFIQHTFLDTVWYPEKIINTNQYFKKNAQSGYLKNGESIALYYPNNPRQIFISSLSGISLSLFLTTLIIGSLLFLLKIINAQKKASEIKNDLISNLTHEFKTPIATVSAALESFGSFQAANDAAKSAVYLDISRKQLDKLNGMVERLLEAATLKTNRLVLQEESADWVLLIRSVVEKFQLRFPEKQFRFDTNLDAFIKTTDVFHLENILANLLDNAAKYGGSEIEVALRPSGTEILLSVSDNGNGIPKKYRKELFEQFFRVPSGNTHNVKGFGIGLFYVKTLVEKMGGNIRFEPDAGFASQFIIRFKK